MTAVHVALFLAGYAVKAAVTYMLWRRFGSRVRSLGRLARRRRGTGHPVLVRPKPGSVSRTFRLGPPARPNAVRSREVLH